MFKFHNLLLTMVTISIVNAQNKVGINTQDPIGILNVDGAGDNASIPESPTRYLNDFIVDTNGNVGIGTIAPTQKLHINSQVENSTATPLFTLRDGTQGNKKILFSDVNGNASWKLLNLGETIIGEFSWNGNTPIGNGNWNSVASVTIPPGVYIIMGTITLYDLTFNQHVRIFYSDRNLESNNTNSGYTPLIGTNDFITSKGTTYSQSNKLFFYNNDSSQNKTIYLNIETSNNNAKRTDSNLTNPTVFNNVSYSENYIVAIPFLD